MQCDECSQAPERCVELGRCSGDCSCIRAIQRQPMSKERTQRLLDAAMTRHKAYPRLRGPIQR